MSSVCAIIPTYNRAGFLLECLESIFGQSRPPDQVIVVNDGSTDDTVNLLKGFGDRITVINKENGGKPSALNVALAQCHADYVWICDDDDLALPDGLERLVQALDADPEAGMAYGNYRFLYDVNGRKVYREQTHWLPESEPNPKIRFLQVMVTNQFAMLVRRSLYESVGPFRVDLARSEDYEMALRLTRRAKAVHVPHVIFSYRQHAGVRGDAANSFDFSKSLEKFAHYDQKIFRDVFSGYTLDEFCPSFALTWSPPLAERAALLNRACILAQHSLWPLAIEELDSLSREQGAAVLSPPEIVLAESLIFHDYAWDSLRADDKSIAALKALGRQMPYGRQVVFAICNRLFRKACKRLFVDRRPEDFFGLLGLLVVLLGPAGAVKRGLRTLTRRRQA